MNSVLLRCLGPNDNDIEVVPVEAPGLEARGTRRKTTGYSPAAGEASRASDNASSEDEGHPDADHSAARA
jgi:hypothetical protein